MNALAQSQAVRFDFARKQLTLAPPSLASVMSTAVQCEDDLVKSWGYDPVALRALKSAPQPLEQAKWYKPQEMPAFADIKGYVAPTGVRYTVGVDGRVSNCIVIQPSGSPAFDQSVCALLAKKARYTPAADANGQPVPALALNSVTWLFH